MTASPTSPRTRSQTDKKSLYKLLLATCWVFAVALIWFEPDNGTEYNYDPTFDVPPRELKEPIQIHNEPDFVRDPDHPDYLPENDMGSVDVDHAANSLEQEEEDSVIEDDDDNQNEIGEILLENSKDGHVSMYEKKDSNTNERIIRKNAPSNDTSSEAAIKSAVNNSGEEQNSNNDDSPESDASEVQTSAAPTKAPSIDDTSIDMNAPLNKTKLLQTTLPEALHPLTSRQCCIPAFSQNKPKDIYCFGTCFHQKVCNDELYPYKSVEEKNSLPIAPPLVQPMRGTLTNKCKSPETLTPPLEWCQKPTSQENDYQSTNENNQNQTDIAQLVSNIPPAGCSKVTSGGGSGPFQHVILFPSVKLAFCGIPKVGITQWEQFLRFTFGAKDYPSLPHYKLDRAPFQFDKLSAETQRKIWEEDSGWTWAAFVRNPAERLLSAYLDKVKGKAQRLKWMEENMSFEDFVDRLAMNFTTTEAIGGSSVSCTGNKNASITGVNWCSDPHWRPQVYSCGISERLDRFAYIGDLNHAAEHTKELLEHVGLWESHGKHYINGGRQMLRSPWCTIASHPYNHTRHLGFQQRDEVTDTAAGKMHWGHKENSKNKLRKYYTPELMEKVGGQVYAEDYKLWKLVDANGAKLSRGKDLAHRLSSRCPSTLVVRPLP